MGIHKAQIGQSSSTKAKLLLQISKQLTYLNSVMYNFGKISTTGITTTVI